MWSRATWTRPDGSEINVAIKEFKTQADFEKECEIITR
jgi:hypothetical protein